MCRLPRDYHKENMNKMRKKEHDLQSKIEEEKSRPKGIAVFHNHSYFALQLNPGR